LSDAAAPAHQLTPPGGEPTAGVGGLRRTLKRRHMEMIALGGVIGAGLFVGSGVVIQSAGPAAVVSFALTGLLVVLVMRMLGEMASAYPAVGGFYEYNRLALGDFAGFMTGWMYWYFWIIVVALEAVAGARLLKFWFPGAPPWMFTLGLMLGFTLMNLLSVRSWGEAEYWFASIKVAAIVVFLTIGAACILGLWPNVAGGLAHLTAHGGFAPHGVAPVLTGAVAATGFYFGSEIVTVAAAESAEPERAVARATQSVIWRVLVLYVGSIFVVVSILPWNHPGIDQPYVTALQRLHIPGAAQIMNGVILTAVLSALNSGLFASSRMITRTCSSDRHPVRICRRGHELRVPRSGVRVPGQLLRYGRDIRVRVDRDLPAHLARPPRARVPGSAAGAHVGLSLSHDPGHRRDDLHRRGHGVHSESALVPALRPRERRRRGGRLRRAQAHGAKNGRSPLTVARCMMRRSGR
jgi:GABA permease